MNVRVGYQPILNGSAALEDVLLGRVRFRTALEAVARYTVFLHPKTVERTHGEALFPVARDAARRGKIELLGGRSIMWDDNTSPTRAFLWAAQRKRGPDVQFNHIYKGTNDPDLYTALWNICVTPAFLAKLTDVKRHESVRSALKRRSFDLYGHLPSGEPEPDPPEGYDSLEWCEHPPPVADLRSVLRERLERSHRSRQAEACRKIGWYFSCWKPDHTLPKSS